MRTWVSERIQHDTQHGKVPDTHEDWAMAMLDSGARERLLYLPVSGWYVWEDKSWRKDPEGQLSRALVADFATCYREAPFGTEDEDLRKKLRSQQRRAEQQGHVTAVMNALSSRLTLRTEDLDPDPWMLNTPDGVLDLKTRRLLSHAPTQRMTMITRGSYDPEALVNSRWLRAIREIVPNDQRRQFLQEMAGLSLLGKQLEQIAILMYGPTARNGKSTVAEALQQAAGTYAAVGDPAILTAADRHPENLAALYRRRIAMFSELPEDKTLAAAGFKRLTGDDTITARFLFRDRFEYTPEFMIMIRANDLPYVPGDDEGTWRRIKVVLFEVQFEGTEDDRGLRHVLRDEPGESSAVLTWAVEGLARYLARPDGQRYWEPECVTNDTQELRDSLDPVGQFLRECTKMTESKSFATYHEIHDKYIEWWAGHSGGKAGISQTSLTRKLKKRPGYKHSVNGQGYRGIGNIEVKPVSAWLRPAKKAEPKLPTSNLHYCHV